MAKRGDPNVLRLVVIILRSLARMSQEEFGKEARLTQARVSLYETGEVPPSDKVLRRMAKVAQLDWPLVVHLRQFLTSFLALAARRGAAPPVVKALDATLLESVWLAVTPYLLELAAEPTPPSPEQERQAAEQIWIALEGQPVRFLRRLLELAPQAGTWALALRLCEASLVRAAHQAGDALELAELALSIADRVPGEEGWRSRLQGYCWAHLANSRRVANDLAGAGEAITQCWRLWQVEALHGPELLAEWRLFSLEASLRRDQHQFASAFELLAKALAASVGDPAVEARILLKKSNVFQQMGDSAGALAALMEAAPLVEALGDPRLGFGLHFDTANNLCLLKRYEEAAERLPQVRELAMEQANDLDLLRVAWLSARVAAGQGRKEEAIAGLNEVSEAFTGRGLPYDAALSSLDLAVLLLEAGRTAEVKKLAVAMGQIFQAKGISREALASLKVFCDAAQLEKATVELARKVMAEIERAGRAAPSQENGRDRG